MAKQEKGTGQSPFEQAMKKIAAAPKRQVEKAIKEAKNKPRT